MLLTLRARGTRRAYDKAHRHESGRGADVPGLFPVARR